MIFTSRNRGYSLSQNNYYHSNFISMNYYCFVSQADFKSYFSFYFVILIIVFYVDLFSFKNVAIFLMQTQLTLSRAILFLHKISSW